MTIENQHFWIDRAHDRIPTEIPCQVGPVGGNRKSAVIINLSAGGVKFACSQQVFNLLLPEDQRIPGQVSAVHIEIQFQLQAPDRQKPHSIRTQALVIHTERLAQDSFTLGARFLALRESDIRAITHYIQLITSQFKRL